MLDSSKDCARYLALGPQFFGEHNDGSFLLILDCESFKRVLEVRKDTSPISRNIRDQNGIHHIYEVQNIV